MSDLTSLFDALYTRLLLRDFFGKIVPGSFIILAIVISLPPYSDLYFRDGKMLRVHVILALAIFLGVAWIIAFAVQAFGETFKLIKWHGEKTDREFLKKRVDFGRRASCRESQQLERLIVIKEACGNGFLSLLLGVLILISDTWRERDLWEALKPQLHVLIFILVIIVFLFIMHRKHITRQTDYMNTVLIMKRWLNRRAGLQPCEDADLKVCPTRNFSMGLHLH